jgi:hypothetical protein
VGNQYYLHFYLSLAFPHLFTVSLFITMQEANEAGALRLAKTKLEKQLEDLTWRLHLEKRLRVLLFLVMFFWCSFECI